MTATAAYRDQVLKVRAGMYRDLLHIWPAFDPHDPAAAAAWMAAAGALVRRDRARFAVLARAYLLADAAGSGREIRPAQPAELPAAQLETSLRVTSLVAYATARGAGKMPQQALTIAAVRSSGAATRLALNGGRSVIQETARSGQIEGWRRVGSPQCALCKTILGRFYPASTRSFQCHDHCSCTFEPVYR